MNWDDDALAMIQAAPAMVRPMIRRKIESQASAQKLTRINAEFVNSMMMKKHGKADSSVDGNSKSRDIEQYYARKTSSPLTDAFDADSGVHVFGQGKNLNPQQALDAWCKAAAIKNTGRNRSLYIHVPFCRSRCVFCPFYANRWDAESIKSYAATVVQEIVQLGSTAVVATPLDAVYFGGGTPSDLSPDDIGDILAAIHGNLSLGDDAEITLEGRVWGQGSDVIQAALNGGVNRFSIGVQSFDTALRRSLGRKADCGEVIEFLNELSQHEAAVVIDLIYGLPGQTKRQWLEDLRVLTRQTGVHGVDLYRLKSMPESQMEQMIRDGRLAQRAGKGTAALMFAAGREYMLRMGWQQLSGPHWMRDARERSRYNAMVKAGEDCIPVGAGAGGRIGSVRFFQLSDINEYAKAVEQGRKPIASAIDLGDQCVIVDTINRQFEARRIMPESLALKDAELVDSTKKLLSQWTYCGLLDLLDDNTYALTEAGEFWSIQMASRLAGLVQSEK